MTCKEQDAYRWMRYDAKLIVGLLSLRSAVGRSALFP